MTSSGLRTVVALALSSALLIALLWQIEPGTVVRALAAIDWTAAAIAFACVSASFLIAGVRYWVILRTFHQRIGIAPTIRANFAGLVGGLLFFQVVGQTLSRWMSLRRHGLSPSSVVVTSLYERSLALVILLAAALLGAISLYGGISVELQRESIALAKSLVLIIVSAAAVSAFVLRRPLTILMRSMARGANWPAIALGGLLTLLVHAAMLAAYLSLVVAFAPAVPLTQLAAAAVVIMLAASFPISFAGWGVRELGAVFAFGIVGVSAGEALAVSVSIGALSVLSIVIVAGLIFLLPDRRHGASISEPAETASAGQVDFTRFLFAATPIGIACLIMFHVWLPVDAGFVNINLADPIALLGGILFLLYFRQFDLSGAYPRLMLFIATATLLLLFGLVHGLLRFGYSEWAVVNRGVGWLFILGYFASGGILAATSRYAGFTTIVRLLVWVTVVIIVADLALLTLQRLGVTTFAAITPFPRLYGESGNPNAFAFQLLIVLAGAAVLTDRASRNRTTSVLHSALFVTLFSAIYLTYSRAALPVLAALAVGAAIAGYRRFGRLVKGLGLTAMILFVVPDIPAYVQMAGTMLQDPGSGSFSGAARQLPATLNQTLPSPLGSDVALSRPDTEAERMQSIRNGWTLFKENPFFGAGLGAGMELSLTGGEVPLVIHSVPFWILAEFGLLGAVISATLFVSIALYLWKQLRTTRRPVYAFGLLMLLIFAVFGLPHDIFYQRLFWFLLGIVLFQGARLQRRAALPVASEADSRHASTTPSHPQPGPRATIGRATCDGRAAERKKVSTGGRPSGIRVK